MNPSSDLARHGYQILEKLSPAPGTARSLTLKITKLDGSISLRMTFLPRNARLSRSDAAMFLSSTVSFPIAPFPSKASEPAGPS